MADTTTSANVELGFVQSAAPCKLLSRYFPSKVGGKPAWLNLKDLPAPEELLCGACSRPMILLMQIYAPVDEFENCFHRTLFVFLCKDPECCKANCVDNFAVFRSQLARQNGFYGYDPPKETENVDAPADSTSQYHCLCSLCGCWGPKRCARCQISNYCSIHHQRIDWKLGHKEICKGETANSSLANFGKYLLPEYEIVTETEDWDPASRKEANETRTEEERIKEYEEYVEKLEKENKTFLAEDATTTQDGQDLEGMAASKMDKHFRKFRERIDHEPDQILRYQRGGIPLWVSSDNIPSGATIPLCSCGADRQFEFQILPQLLNYLKLDAVEKSIDWGTLLIYSCSKNCEYENRGYHKECILKQDFSPDAS